MVHSAVQTESKIRGAVSWLTVENMAADHENGVRSFSQMSFEVPDETLLAGDEVAAVLAGEVEKEEVVNESEGEETEKDPFAASDRIGKPEELLMEGFKKGKELDKYIKVISLSCFERSKLVLSRLNVY